MTLKFVEGLLTVCSQTYVRLTQLEDSGSKPVVRKHQLLKEKKLKEYWKMLKHKKIDIQLFLIWTANLVGKRSYEFLNRKLKSVGSLINQKRKCPLKKTITIYFI